MSVAEAAKAARKAGRALVDVPSGARAQVLRDLAEALDDGHVRERIFAANRADLARFSARTDTAPSALLGRLKLDDAKLGALSEGLVMLAALPDPVSEVTVARMLDDGLVLERQRCPLGVLGVVFESRPDAVIQIAGLALKSGNAVLLKGGSEALDSNRALIRVIHRVLGQARLDMELATLLEGRADVDALLNLEHLVDLVVARGSSAFVRYVRERSRIPVMAHSEGLCHLYLHKSARPDTAARLVLDSKVSYPSACNAVETLLWERGAEAALESCVRALELHGVELRGCVETRALHPALNPAAEEDWDTEYGALVLSIRAVSSLDEALAHIDAHGSRHTDAIVAEDTEAAGRFLREVDAACVFHNASTRFSDGYRFGLGAEVGISTDKLQARGPVGVEGLLTHRWILRGKGHVASDYGPGKRAYLHRDLPLSNRSSRG